MKWMVLFLLIGFSAFAQPGLTSLDALREKEDAPLPVGSELMRQVRAQLPPMPLELRGTIRTRQNKKQQDRRLITTMRFGDPVPSVSYLLADNFGETLTKVKVSWPRGQALFEQWDGEGKSLPAPAPQDQVWDTGLTWSDLSLDFLWWEGAKVLERDRVKNRSAFVAEIRSPPERPEIDTVKLWIDERALFIVRAELMDSEGKLLKRIEVDSIKKVREDFWMVKDLVILDRAGGRRMGIRFAEVIELDSSPQHPSSESSTLSSNSHLLTPSPKATP